MDAIANLNGKQMPLAEVMIPALDRGFLFGDAVYEVLRIYAGKPWLEQEHFQRFEQSLAAIRIQGVNLQRLRERMHETIVAGGFRASRRRRPRSPAHRPARRARPDRGHPRPEPSAP